MALHIDTKYIHLISCQFEKFTRKSDYLFNVRCPLCGDSATKKTKMRGYIYRSKQRMAYKCHNCNVSLWLGALIKSLNPQLYREYVLESYRESKEFGSRARTLLKEPGFFDQPGVRFGHVDPVIYQHAEKISDLPNQHYCREYVISRKIPKEYWTKLYYTDRYREFLDEVAPNHGKQIKNDARLVIPYYDKYGAVIAVTGRALRDSDASVRYITVRTTQDTNKLIYGLDRIDQSKRVYIVEGPLDSLFLSNALASGDSNLIQVANALSAVDVVLIYDNEPRQRENVIQLEKAIKEGHAVVIWPEWVKEKDINAMVLAGRPLSDIQTIIHSHIYSGLVAFAHLTFWKKTTTEKRGWLS